MAPFRIEAGFVDMGYRKQDGTSGKGKLSFGLRKHPLQSRQSALPSDVYIYPWANLSEVYTGVGKSYALHFPVVFPDLPDDGDKRYRDADGEYPAKVFFDDRKLVAQEIPDQGE